MEVEMIYRTMDECNNFCLKISCKDRNIAAFDRRGWRGTTSSRDKRQSNSRSYDLKSNL